MAFVGTELHHQYFFDTTVLNLRLLTRLNYRM